MRELTTVVLASVSPRRLELLSSLGLTVRVVPSNVLETPQPSLTPVALASLHAAAKAQAVAARESHDLIVAADTVVDIDGRAFGKPCDFQEAERMLAALSGRSHLVHTAFSLIDPLTQRRLDRSSSTQVTFAALTPAEITAYVASGESFDKAGAYGIQGRGAALVERVNGDFYTVMGFPLGLFLRSLAELNYTLHNALGTRQAREGAA